MGVLHNELKEGDFGKAVENALGLDLAEGGLERVGETLQPTFNMWERPEWAVLRGERLWAVQPSQPAVVGEFSSVGIAVPANSKVIAVIDQIILFPGFGNALTEVALFNIPAGGFTSTSTPNPRDSRIPWVGGTTPTIGVISFAHHQVAVPFPAFFMNITPAAGQPPTAYSFPIVITPGFALFIEPFANNTRIDAAIIGRSRPARRGEL